VTDLGGGTGGGRQSIEGEARDRSVAITTSYLDYCYQFARLLSDPVYRGNGAPKGRGEPVLLIPGFFAGDWTLRVMAGWLSRIGYRPYLSGIDWNVGLPNRTAELLGWRLAYIIKETRSPVVVVGHSLGGLLARFLGAHFPESVRHVIALGAPIHSPLQALHPFIQLTLHTLQILWGSVDDLAPKFAESVSSPLPQRVGFTAIFSTEDELVDWRSCLDPQEDNREVSGGHLGLVVNREVYRTLATVLVVS